MQCLGSQMRCLGCTLAPRCRSLHGWHHSALEPPAGQLGTVEHEEHQYEEHE